MDFGDKEYTGRRLRTWLAEMLKRLEITHTELASELGYERSNIVGLWLSGKAKLSMEHIPKLAKMFIVDPAVLIPLYIDQDVRDEDLREKLFEISCRIVPEWEFDLHLLAREIYIANDEYIWFYSPDHFN